jgi:hypothetical protein
LLVDRSSSEQEQSDCLRAEYKSRQKAVASLLF